MYKKYSFFLLLSLPLLLKYVFLLIFIDFDLLEIGDMFEDMLFYMFVVFVFYANIFKKQIFVNIIYIIYLLYFVLETTSYMAVSSNFSSSYMYLLIESNRGELKEFVSSYFSIPIMLFILIIIGLFFVIRKQKLIRPNSKKIITGITCFLSIVVFLKFTGLIESNAYHNILRGVYGYVQLQNSVKLNTNIAVSDIQIKSDNEVLVIVLGESTTTGHMQLYGYDRETTPLLNSIKDSLLIYNDVISTDVFTLKAVPKILTTLDNTRDLETSTNLVEIFNKAGFNSFWFSNQRPISYHDNAISRIASGSHHFKFYNHVIDKHSAVLDEIVFPDYEKTLNLPGKKIIFIRLIGTHFDYNKRYPESFNKFLSVGNLSKRERIINEYDNAVLYNDFIVYSLIKNLQKQNKKSALLYLSDHGENVYDETDFFGRSEEILTKTMFEIPFLMWVSKDFELPNDFEYKPDRVFMADHTYDSVGHFFGVLYTDMDASRSIFSNSFKERKRTVINNIDYNSYFVIKHE
jgi:heptose-I-phosphate ethanolaminephosphotransferase